MTKKRGEKKKNIIFNEIWEQTQGVHSISPRSTHLHLALTQMSQMSVSVIGNMADILRTDGSYKQISTLRYLI